MELLLKEVRNAIGMNAYPGRQERVDDKDKASVSPANLNQILLNYILIKSRVLVVDV